MQKKVILALVLISAFVYVSGINSSIGMGDASHYIVLARSLISGQGYTDIYMPAPLPHKTYPPLFPLLLCPLLLVFGENILIFKMVSLISMVMAGVLFFFLLKEEELYIRNWTAFLFVLSPIILMYSGVVLSEALYLALSFTAILFLQKYEQQTTIWNKYFILSIICMGASFYARTIGIALGAGAVCFFLCTKKFKKAFLIFIAFGLIIVPWVLKELFVGSVYVDFFSKTSDVAGLGVFSLVKRVASNALVYAAKVMADVFFFPLAGEITRVSRFFSIKVLMSCLLSFAIALGFFSTLSKKMKLIHFYSFFVILICLVWPVHTARFLLPIYGLLIVFLFQGLHMFVREKRVLIAVVAVFLLLSNVYADSVIIYKNRLMPYNEEEQAYLDALGWIRDNTDETSIVMCRKPRVSFFKTKRRAMLYPYTVDAKEALATVKENKIDFIIFDSLGKKWKAHGMWSADKFLRPLLGKYPDYFTKVYRADSITAVYKVQRGKL